MGSCSQPPVVMESHWYRRLDDEARSFSAHADVGGYCSFEISQHPSCSHSENPLWACSKAVSRRTVELVGETEASTAWVRGRPSSVVAYGLDHAACSWRGGW